MFSNYSLGGAAPSMFKSLYSKLTWSLLVYIILIILFILVIVYFYNKSSSSSSDTYKINRENMGTKNNNKAELILFYVDWCPHCKTAKPEWEKLKGEYEGKTINGFMIVFTEYNCTNETAEIQELISKFKIEGYPTIKLIKEGQVIEYDAKPTKATLEQFLNTVL